MDARKTRTVGIAMAVVGAVAHTLGIVTDAVRHFGDRAARGEGIFDLSKLPHALSFGGLLVVILGLLLMLAGPRLYTAEPGSAARRFAQGLVPVLALAGVVGVAAAADGSRLGDRAVDTVRSTAAAGAQRAAASRPTSTTMGAMPGIGAGGATTGADGSPTTMATVSAWPAGKSPCELASPVAASPGQTGNGAGGSQGSAEGQHGPRGMTMQKPLTRAERQALDSQMRLARSVIDKYPTVKDALAAGYSKSTPYVPCIGAHYTNTRLVARFDPAAPSELLYDGTDPGAKIVGLSYLNFSANGPPAGFAGPNDNWHQHNSNGGLCLKGGLVVGGESTSEAECTKLGGEKAAGLMQNIWMVHAWVVPGFECSWGVFAGECPELGGTLGGTAWDLAK